MRLPAVLVVSVLLAPVLPPSLLLATFTNNCFRAPPPSSDFPVVVGSVAGTANGSGVTNRPGSTPPADLLLLLGDMAYGNGKTDGDDSGYTEKTFDSYKEDLTHTPMFSILGNHEMKSHLTIDGIGYGTYFQRFITPQNGESGGVPSHSAGTVL